METEFRNFNNSKALQGSNISVKIVKSSLDIFQQVLHQELNRFIELSRFPGLLKATNMSQQLKNMIERIIKIIDQSVYYQTCPKF